MCRAEKETASKEIFRREKLGIRLARSEHYYVAELEIDLFSKCIKSVVVRQPQRGGRHA